MKLSFKKDRNVIDNFSGRYCYLSNFYPCEFRYREITWPTAEHAYQAMKSHDRMTQYIFAGLKTPALAKKLGRQIQLRSDWKSVKDLIMYEIVSTKFRDPVLGGALLHTRDAKLVEGNTWNDRYWGVCKGVGENKLGRILMAVREEIRNELS